MANGREAVVETPIRNVVDYIFGQCLEPAHASRPALILDDADGTSVSFAELYARVCRCGNLFGALGLGIGDRIMMSLMDGPDFPAVFLGGMKNGAITIPINTWLTPKDYLYYLNDSGAKAMVVDHSLAPVVAEIEDALDSIEHIIFAGEPVAGYPFLDDLASRQPDTFQTIDRDPDDTAFWLYSSGTTGNPKGVIHTHAHIYWATELFGLGTQRIGHDDVVFCPPKMFFAYGLGNQVYFPLRAAATNVVNSGRITPAACWKLWLEHEPTIVMSVPTLFAGMLQMAEKELGKARVRKACRRLRYSVSGGELLPPALLKRWKAFTGTDILDGVGTTETTHMFLLNEAGNPVPGSCGRIVDGYSAEIIDDHGDPVPRGEVGMLLVHGQSIASEYWNQPEKTKAAFGRGGVLTGDNCYVDEAGNYFHAGRSDDMLRVGGIWVSPTEVEAALCEHDAVLECAVVGNPDDQNMIKPKAYVILRDGAAAGEDELIAFVRERLAHYKAPRWVELVTELPKTTTGKIQRFRLRADR